MFDDQIHYIVFVKAIGAGRCFVGGLFFVAGAGAFLSALLGSKYGALGSKPSDWLKRGVIDRESPQIGLMLAYLVANFEERISVSVESNKRKYCAVHCGMALVAPVIDFDGKL